MMTQSHKEPENVAYTTFPANRISVRLGLLSQLLGLSLMIGGMLALGAFTAPVIFSHLPRPEAATLMGLIFRRSDRVLLIALGLLWLGQIPVGLAALRVRWQAGSRRRLPFFKLGLMLGLTGTMLYSTLVVNPEIERLQQAGLHRTRITEAGRRFDALHHRSETLYKADLLMATLLLALIPLTWPWFAMSGSNRMTMSLSPSSLDPVHPVSAES